MQSAEFEKPAQVAQTSKQKILFFSIAGVLASLSIFLLGGWLLLQNQEEPKEPFVVVLPIRRAPPTVPLVEGFLEKMEELGYQEGVDVVYERTEYIESTPEGLAQIRELYRSHIAQDLDLIVAVSNVDTPMVLEETKIAGKFIPVIAGDMTDPVEVGLIESFQSSGNNLTGVAEKRNDTLERALDLFTRVVPGIKRIGVASDGFMVSGPTAPGPAYLKALRQAAEKLDIEIVEYTTIVPPGHGYLEEVEKVFDNIQEGEIDAFVHLPAHLYGNQQAYEHEMTLRIKAVLMLPAIEYDDKTGEPMGLFVYGADFHSKGKQLAVMADKILRGGVSPSEIPIELPLKYSVAINLKTAEAIGITVPQEILELADVIIE